MTEQTIILAHIAYNVYTYNISSLRGLTMQKKILFLRHYLIVLQDRNIFIHLLITQMVIHLFDLPNKSCLCIIKCVWLLVSITILIILFC